MNLPLIFGGILLAVVALPLCAAPGDDAPNLAVSLDGIPPTLSVDSTFSGYKTAVLTDGKWIAPGEETTQDYGSADRLGNGGNTWASGATPGAEHWVRLDWPAAITVSEVQVWWSKEDWHPKAFRIEYLSDQSWVPIMGANTWYEASERHSVLGFEPLQVQSLRLLQHAQGDRDRGIMALQEIIVRQPEGPPAALSGVRELTPEEVRHLNRLDMVRNIARLHETQPGASRGTSMVPGIGTAALLTFGGALGVADGDCAKPADIPRTALKVGVSWPIQHVIDGATLYFSGGTPESSQISPAFENHFVPSRPEVVTEITQQADGVRVELSFDPIACDAVWFWHKPDGPKLTEIEVYRYMPPGPASWPESLTGRRLEEHILASDREPSYEELCTQALSMRPAHALLGLKDAREEIGVKWDGKLVVRRETLEFFVGEKRESLADYPDTVRRRLVDGWRPGTEVTGQIGGSLVTQTAFVGLTGPDQTLPALFMRVELLPAGLQPEPETISLRISGPNPVNLEMRDGAVYRDGRPALIVQGASATVDGSSVVIDLPEGRGRRIDLVYPLATGDPADVNLYAETSFSAALDAFKRYWDDLLAEGMTLEVPEGHVSLLYKAVLTQIFINADGDIMPYGSQPSVYDGNLYGLEEGFAMSALALSGFSADAQRYMDATYLTPDFLVKVPEYKVYADRHQQYRNGLQPFYATGLYRLTRNREWIEKHVQLFRDCAEWTIENRKKTMQLEDGKRPLHWGLLPKWSYGGDIAGLQCYALYANFACWRGLHETAWVLDELGDHETAERYFREAEEYRALLREVVEANYQPDHDPPFVPLRLYATEPVGNDYYQLFAGVLLDLLPFELDGKQIDYFTDYLEQADLMFCGLPRFRRDVGPGGLDGLYGLGYLLTKLHQDKVDEFLLGFYAYLAFNMERDTFASRETNLIYASDLHVRSQYKVPDMSDPIPCSSAVPLLLLRHMLITERLEGPGLPSGHLDLLLGAPRVWFRDGEKIHVAKAPTQFGELSLDVNSEVAEGRIEAVVTPPTRDAWKSIGLRLRHPEGKPIQRVSVNGQPSTDFDAAKEQITLAPGATEYRVVAEY